MKTEYLVRSKHLSGAIGLLHAAIIIFVAGAAFAADSAGQKAVDGIHVYYAVTPAEILRGYPKDTSEGAMHGGVPAGQHYHHVMVALFESKSLERITDAEVMATVREIGLGGTRKQLEPFTSAGALTYGNYFKMPTSTIYRIDLKIRRPGSQKVVETYFEYRHH